ncbi:insulin-degrading enzyme-like [Tropilaelaps mercedesae]|uniref:Insulin-degrading enzyme-like n=1 Tax=Tropilaelaps mercedesae TaxID=418985 RepID=A0A1V9XKP0_9ACAR|nr:insulin-degrading enzyme-like [Tropilaelaps mercedesae]
MSRLPGASVLLPLMALVGSLPLLIFVLVRFLLPVAEPINPWPPALRMTEVTTKPDTDRNIYRGLDLANGMKVLLASDPNVEKARVALCVMIGFMSDPWELQGLAHFTEHMVFMGSQRYPDENRVFSFLHSHGGQVNAFTANDATCYYYEDTLYAGARKLNTTLVAEIRKFYNKFYVGQLMSVMVQGRESLDELQRLALRQLSPVRRGEVTVPEWPTHPFINSSRLLIHIVPALEHTTLEIVFPIPEMARLYRSQPDVYVAMGLLNPKTPGSLYAYLHSKTLVTGVLAKGRTSLRNFSIFRITFSLTELGFRHIDEIVEALFAYIAFHRRVGPQEHVFNDIKLIKRLNFKFRPHLPLSDFARIADRLRTFELWEDVISGQWLVHDYRPDLIENLLDHLSPYNCRITLQSPTFVDEPDLRVEPLYNVSYSVVPIPEDKLRRWNASQPQSHHKFAVPPPNRFIPDEFPIHRAEPELSHKPVLLQEDSRTRLWILQNDAFKTPKSMVYVIYRTDIIRRGSSDIVKLALVAKTFLEANEEELGAARMAGSKIDVVPVLNGLVISVNGYNQKQLQILKSVLNKLKHFTISRTAFNMAKEQLEDVLKAAPARRYHSVMTEIRDRLLHADFNVTWRGQLEHLEGCSLENTQDLLNRIRARLTAVTYVHGNAHKDTALDMFAAIKELIQETSLTLKGITPTHEFALEKGFTYHYAEAIEQQPLNSVQVFYDVGPTSNNMRKQLVAELFGLILIDQTSDVLRTKEQLGYNVNSVTRKTMHSHGFMISVESGANVTYVEKRIIHFVHVHVREYLAALTENTFNEYREALVNRKLEKPTSIDYGKKLVTNEFHGV